MQQIYKAKVLAKFNNQVILYNSAPGSLKSRTKTLLVVSLTTDCRENLRLGDGIYPSSTCYAQRNTRSKNHQHRRGWLFDGLHQRPTALEDTLCSLRVDAKMPHTIIAGAFVLL